MSGIILNWAARVPVPSVYEKAVLLVLAEAAATDSHQTWIGQDTIAERCQMSRRKVVGAMAALEASGLLSRSRRFAENGNRTSDLITLLPCAPGAPCEGEQDARCALGLPRPSAPQVVDQVHAVRSNPKRNPKKDITSLDQPESKPTARQKTPSDPAFESLWFAYPHHPGRSNKAASYTSWKALSDPDRALIVEAVGAFALSPQATENNGRYVKGFHLWIRYGLWRDFAPKISAASLGAAPEVNWAQRMETFKNTGAWPSGWGEKPGRDGCIVPADILRKFGYGPAATPGLRVIEGGAG